MMTENSIYMTTDEVSQLTRVPAETLRYFRHVRHGGPPSFKLGRRVLYARTEVERWIETAQAAATAS